MKIEEVKELVLQKKERVEKIREEISKEIVGQEYMIDRILIGLFTGGHILLEGVPGLAKSRTVNSVAKAIGCKFQRIQFTPDLLPADIIGTEIYKQNSGEFVIKKGPVFTNILLADEINRAPAKVQSALLEAMQEKQITIGDDTFILDKPFLVLATQNPLEQEGTYPLPEAQQDRFMLKLKVEYPSKAEEKLILNMLTGDGNFGVVENAIDTKELFEIRGIVSDIYVDDKIKDYVLDIVFATRDEAEYIECGASPRATVNLILAAKAYAFLNGKHFVTPDDVKAIAYDVLRHRLQLSYEAEADDYSVEDIIKKVLEKVYLP